ncbi:DEAD/DEAH box helicase [Bifidobacterium gallicum]|uniref:SNF2 family N-terminal domain protein n=1 Tax=Bifidobacterium gallicum DSM 20093 = LMG 11596 TaxID=561180 RepID=D1NTD4_9BIFI|nr:DEAD/DEAH box helicase [Bifidobacterium gallicum]EFA22988.1 SNF2 family N-terminal domain protein [Bifidobacterium gallicum DSM 20093 = LMG 11596]KFI57694.1 SNF2 family protein [Bifidobacterium gallicum DSM 20093 = LMG 11596]
MDNFTYEPADDMDDTPYGLSRHRADQRRQRRSRLGAPKRGRHRAGSTSDDLDGMDGIDIMEETDGMAEPWDTDESAIDVDDDRAFGGVHDVDPVTGADRALHTDMPAVQDGDDGIWSDPEFMRAVAQLRAVTPPQRSQDRMHRRRTGRRMHGEAQVPRAVPSSPWLASLMASADADRPDTVAELQETFMRHSTMGGYLVHSAANAAHAVPDEPLRLRVELDAPSGDDDDIHWAFRLQVYVQGRWYRIQKIPTLMRALRKGLRYRFGAKWEFVPKRSMFASHDQQLITVLTDICRAYTAANDASFRNDFYGMARVPYNRICISLGQLMALLTALMHSGDELTVTDPRYRQTEPQSTRITGTDTDGPLQFADLGFTFSALDAAGAPLEPDPHSDDDAHATLPAAYTLTRDLTVLDGCSDDHHAFLLVSTRDGLLRFVHTPPFDMTALDVLKQLGSTIGPLVIGQADFAHFAQSITPVLTAFGQGVSVPAPLQARSSAPCRLAFYLDRSDDGLIVCETFAEYDGQRFDVFAEHMAFGPSAITPQVRVMRNETAEEFARQVTGVYFHTPYPVSRPGSASIPVPADAPRCAPYLDIDSSGELLTLLNEGIDALRSVGDVFTTDKVTGFMREKPAHVRLGLSVTSDLVRVTPMADEIDESEVAAILDSYRKRKTYHRLADGTFMRLDSPDIAQANALVERYHLSLSALANGQASVPAVQAFLLDGEDEDLIEQAPSFRDYIGDVKVVDPQRYVVPAALHATLRPYQLEGYRWLRTLMDKHLGGILADDMGLGKTVQMISVLVDATAREQQESIQEQRQPDPCLVVCPASLVYNWARELRNFAPDLPVSVVAGAKAQRRKQYADLTGVVVTSYDVFRLDIDDLADQRWLVMVLDEAQAIKNPATKIAQAVKRAQARHRFALTGTPIENRLSELWSIFDFLMPGFLGSYRSFRDTYEKPMLDGRDDVAQRLHHAVRPFILRRLKRDVLTDLPEKTESVIDVALTGEQRKLYAASERKLRMMLQSSQDMNEDRFQVLSALTQLRQLCCDPRLVFENVSHAGAKMDAIAELVTAARESGQKVLIFSQFVSFLDLIADMLDELGVAHMAITGSTPKQRRLELVDTFNMDDTPVMLISLKAGGTGLNLTGASVVIHADPWWNEAAQNQATDRAHRIGQRHTVNVYKIVASDTVEERILGLQERKSELARTLLDTQSSVNVAAMTRDDVLALLG